MSPEVFKQFIDLEAARDEMLLMRELDDQFEISSVLFDAEGHHVDASIRFRGRCFLAFTEHAKQLADCFRV